MEENLYKGLSLLASPELDLSGVAQLHLCISASVLSVLVIYNPRVLLNRQLLSHFLLLPHTSVTLH